MDKNTISKEFIKAFNGIMKGEKWHHKSYDGEYNINKFYALGYYDYKNNKYDVGKSKYSPEIFIFVKTKKGRFDRRQTKNNCYNFHINIMTSKDWKRIT